MNETATESQSPSQSQNAAAEYASEAQEYLRRNPGSAILVAIGAGVAIGLIVRALRPEPTAKDRLVDLLEDVEARLRSAAKPAWRKASSLASEGLHSAHDGEAWLERLCGDSMRRMRRLFS